MQSYEEKVDNYIKAGFIFGKIREFDEEFVDKLKSHYFDGLPVYMEIKYFSPKDIMPEKDFKNNKCFDRSFYMFCCCEDATLVHANTKYHEHFHGKDNAGHGWVEIGDWVYDPSAVTKVRKDLYYKMFEPYDIHKITKDEFCSLSEDHKKAYENISETTIDDLRPYGKKRLELGNRIPQVIFHFAQTDNQELYTDLVSFLKEVQYDPDEIEQEINEKFEEIKKTRK